MTWIARVHTLGIATSGFARSVRNNLQCYEDYINFSIKASIQEFVSS